MKLLNTHGEWKQTFTLERKCFFVVDWTLYCMVQVLPDRPFFLFGASKSVAQMNIHRSADFEALKLWKRWSGSQFFSVQKVSLWVHLCTYIAHRTEWLFQHKTPTYMYLRPIRNSQLKTVPSRWGPFLVLQRNWKKPKRNLFSFANRFLFRIEIKIDQAWLFPKSKCRSLI